MKILSMFMTTIIMAIQPQPKALSCVASMQNPVLTVWMYRNPEFAIPNNIWNELLQIEGHNIWIGYNNGGWDIPDDAIGSWKITGDNMEVWIWQSESAYKYYVFPFANTELFADSNGNHYGMHPCGAYEVNRRELNSHIINIINRSND